MKQISFVAWGRSALLAAHEAKIRQAVEAKYVAELAQARFLGRLSLRIRIEREIWRELDRTAPNNALYFQSCSQNADTGNHGTTSAGLSSLRGSPATLSVSSPSVSST